MEILKHFKIWVLCLLLTSLTAKAQEDAFYNALDTFLEGPSQQKLEDLEQTRNSLYVPDNASLLARVIVDSNLGYYKNLGGNIQSAIISYENAANAYIEHQLEGYDIVSYVLIPLGNLYTKTNALSEAERVIQGYISLSRKQKNIENLISGLINLSIPLQNQGKYNGAINVLKEALKMAPKNMDAQINLATCYISIGKYNEARILCAKIISQDKNQLNVYGLLAQIAIRNERPEEAIVHLKKSISIQESQTNRDSRILAKTYLATADTYITQKQSNLAQEYLEKTFSIFIPTHQAGSLPSTSILYPENTLLDALDLQAQLYIQEKKKLKALEAFGKAAFVSDLLNTTQLQSLSRLHMQRTDKERSELRISLLYELFKETGNNHFFEKALQVSDRSKGRILNETVLKNEALNAYTNNESIQAYKQLQNRLIAIENELLNARMNTGTSIVSIENLQERYAREIVNLREMQRKIDKEFPNLKLRSETLKLTSLASSTKERGETVVNYFFGSTSVYAFYILGENYDWKKLASTASERDILFQLCVRFNSYFDSASVILNDPQAFTMDAFKLYEALELPESKNLTIIPDGMLSFIPFNALLSKIPNHSDFSNMAFLLKASVISYNTSLSTYQTEQKHKNGKKTILGVFPVFEGTDLELSHSVTEAQGLSKHFKTTLLLKEEALAESAFAKANTHHILHFSTHATGGTFSTPAQLSFFDKPIFVTELNGLQLDTELVVLSACETGVGRIASGEGVFSLARGFQQAGAQSILFSLWKVNDKSTAMLMNDFYSTLKKSNAKNYSLQKAQLDYLENPNITNTQKTPYHWASFVYYGNSEFIESSFDIKWVLILSLLSLFLIFILIKKYGFTS